METAKRTSQACEICHQRKVKCNSSEEFPCRNCVVAKVECVIRKHKKRKTKVELENDYFQIGYLKTVKLPIDSISLDQSVLLRNRNSKFNENLPTGYQVLKDINLFEENVTGPEDILDETDLQYLTFIGAFNLPDKRTCDAYIQSCFQRLLFGSIIFDQDEFEATYADLTKPPSLLLLQAVLFYGALLTPTSHLSQEEKEKHQKVVEVLFKRAKALYDIGSESNPIPLCQALLIFRYSTLFSNVNQQYLYWTRTVIATALRFDMDKKVENNDNLTTYEKKMFKRIWWIIFLRDKYSAFVCGRPCALNFLACEATSLTSLDLLNTNETLNSLSGERIYSNYVFLSLIKLLKIIDIFVSGSTSSNNNTPHLTGNASASTSSSNSPSGTSDVSFDILRFDQLMKYYLNDINIAHLVKILPNGVTGLVTAFLYVLFLIHRSNLIKECRENAKRNIKINDHNSSWGIAFISSCLLIQLSEVQIEYDPQAFYHSQNISLIIYTVYSAGITLCMFLLVLDPNINAVVEKQVLNAIKLLKKIESLAEKDAYNIRIFLKILESLLSSKAKQYKLLKILTGIKANKLDPTVNDIDDETKATTASRSIPISSLLCLPPELNEWPSVTRGTLHAKAPNRGSKSQQTSSKNGCNTGKIHVKKQFPAKGEFPMSASMSSTVNNTPDPATPSASLTPFSEGFMKSQGVQGSQIDLELNTASQFTPEELLNQFIKIFNVCSIYFFPHQNQNPDESEIDAELIRTQAEKVRIIDEEYSTWSSLNITESWVPEFDLEFDGDVDIENTSSSSFVTPKSSTTHDKAYTENADTNHTDNKTKSRLGTPLASTPVNDSFKNNNNDTKGQNINPNLDPFGHIKSEVGTHNEMLPGNVIVHHNPHQHLQHLPPQEQYHQMNNNGLYMGNMPMPMNPENQNILNNIPMNPQMMNHHPMNNAMVDSNNIPNRIPNHQSYSNNQKSNQMMNQLPNQPNSQPVAHHPLLPQQLPVTNNNQPHHTMETYNINEYPTDNMHFSAPEPNAVNDAQRMSGGINMNMGMNNIGPNINQMNTVGGTSGMTENMTPDMIADRSQLNAMMAQHEGFFGANSRFSEVVNAFTAEFGKSDRGNFGDSIFQL